MSVFSQEKKFSLDEYFAIEATSLEKLEYYDGKFTQRQEEQLTTMKFVLM